MQGKNHLRPARFQHQFLSKTKSFSRALRSYRTRGIQNIPESGRATFTLAARVANKLIDPSARFTTFSDLAPLNSCSFATIFKHRDARLGLNPLLTTRH